MSEFNIPQEVVDKFWKEIEDEEKRSIEAEEKSTLVYSNGQKVLRNDLVIDVKARDRFNNDPYSEPYGYHMIVHRINEDETVDMCLDGNIALKMNNMNIDFNNMELIERGAKIYSPLSNLFENENDDY